MTTFARHNLRLAFYLNISIVANYKIIFKLRPPKFGVRTHFFFIWLRVWTGSIVASMNKNGSVRLRKKDRNKNDGGRKRERESLDQAQMYYSGEINGKKYMEMINYSICEELWVYIVYNICIFRAMFLFLLNWHCSCSGECGHLCRWRDANYSAF